MQPHAHHPTGSSFFDWIPILIVVGIALVYVYARLLNNKKSKGSNWSLGRSISFLLGISLLCIALTPTITTWGHADLRGHMVQHLLIGMFAPIFLVLGAPITLALKVAPVKVARTVTAIFKTPLFRILSHPFIALLLNMGGMYILYLTPLYNQMLSKPYLHAVMHIHFLMAGYLFTWSIIGSDPVPYRSSFTTRKFILFISIASHAFLSKFMYAYLYPQSSPHAAEQIQEAAKLMYYWGDLSELLLTILLFTSWYQSRHPFPAKLTPITP
ncbi:cytochrome c oxidase assembly protein [Adhaeribacter aquaticus]|uniref:cytochrome c oxidase assembly protein n=1 Tax=Adhaeribacter aquaticus TaxID=299567 RepID=UPI000428949E|nr:cytochrome c oxidase assembly protein [Adhaeribacter aquaticus]